MSYILRLTCDHYVETNVVSHEAGGIKEWCPICKTHQHAMDYSRDEWHTRCNSCPFGRSHGMAKVYADSAAARHERMHPTHRVAVQFYNSWRKTASVVGARTEPLMLPGFGSSNADASPPY